MGLVTGFKTAVAKKLTEDHKQNNTNKTSDRKQNYEKGSLPIKKK